MISDTDRYWQVADGGRIYASARNVYVEPDDEAFMAWRAAWGEPTPIASEAELWAVLFVRTPGHLPLWLFDGATFVQPAVGAYTKAQLAAYAADARWRKEVGGIVVSGSPVATDRQSQSMLAGAHVYVQANPAATIRWKGTDGFTTLDAAGVTALALAVGNHVQACFAAEAEIDAAITAGLITTLAEIDTAVAAA